MSSHETNHCTLPPVFDPCCGGRMCYFDKHDSRVLFSDIRREAHTLCDGRVFTVSPDVIADFRKLPYPDAIFLLCCSTRRTLSIAALEAGRPKSTGSSTKIHGVRICLLDSGSAGVS